MRGRWLNPCFLFVGSLVWAAVAPVKAETLAVSVAAPPPAESGYFKTGTTRNPDSQELTINSRSLLLDGRPWFQVMGEFHYARCPTNEWRAELLKMKAGGVDIVSTYVFWIHHEEVEGQWDWSGRRDLHEFVALCGQLGLKVLVRCGPWCHGEVRNGGFPDWVVAHKDWKLRSTDTNFLAAVKILYDQIAVQLRGELWKDGGPVIGIQVDNEFGGSPDYLMALKQIAVAAGLDVPLYTKTGWPAMKKPVPLGELVPFFGAYADGFWGRNLTPMDGNSWENFTFKITRTDTGVGNDTLGNRKAGDTAGTEKYPYLTCEIGGGMETSYHRRILVDPRDVEAVALCQLGSGSSLMGYYMYHGGQNPEGRLTTLNESQATGYPNDLPVKNYDFQAPLGEYGQINPQYHWLRRLHLFLHDFGAELAEMPVSLPEVAPTNKTDLATLRWAVRSDGYRGFVFVNNYQRLQPMPPKTNVQFRLDLPGGPLVFPSQPVTVPADAVFFWPFNLELDGTRLVYATAQPVCQIDDGNLRTFFFAETPGVKAEFVFDTNAIKVKAISGQLTESNEQLFIRDVKPGHGAAVRWRDRSGRKNQIVLLDEADSLALWKGSWAGQERLFLFPDGLAIDGGRLKLFGFGPELPAVGVLPAPHEVQCGRMELRARPDGVFRDYRLPVAKVAPLTVEPELVRPAGPPRQIPLSSGKSHLALAPTEAAFTNAAVWRIKLPANLDVNLNPLLRIRYVGDVARVTLNGRLIDDNFYNGREFELGLRRYAPEILNGDLRLEILPLQRGAPIYLAESARPDFGQSASLARLDGVELVNRPEVILESPPASH